jgi:hypothetical protein
LRSSRRSAFPASRYRCGPCSSSRWTLRCQSVVGSALISWIVSLLEPRLPRPRPLGHGGRADRRAKWRAAMPFAMTVLFLIAALLTLTVPGELAGFIGTIKSVGVRQLRSLPRLLRAAPTPLRATGRLASMRPTVDSGRRSRRGAGGGPDFCNSKVSQVVGRHPRQNGTVNRVVAERRLVLIHSEFAQLGCSIIEKPLLPYATGILLPRCGYRLSAAHSLL